jgi:hypothetical protein
MSWRASWADVLCVTSGTHVSCSMACDFAAICIRVFQLLRSCSLRFSYFSPIKAARKPGISWLVKLLVSWCLTDDVFEILRCFWMKANTGVTFVIHVEKLHLITWPDDRGGGQSIQGASGILRAKGHQIVFSRFPSFKVVDLDGQRSWDVFQERTMHSQNFSPLVAHVHDVCDLGWWTATTDMSSWVPSRETLRMPTSTRKLYDLGVKCSVEGSSSMYRDQNLFGARYRTTHSEITTSVSEWRPAPSSLGTPGTPVHVCTVWLVFGHFSGGRLARDTNP